MPVIVDRQTTVKKEEFIKLYDNSPEFLNGEDASRQFEETQATLYTAVFNTKIIAAVWLKDHFLHHLIVHPANRGRGIADRLLSEVYKKEQLAHSWQAKCPVIQKYLKKYDENA